MSDPKELPNYKHPDYQLMERSLLVLLDVYNDLEPDKKSAYLPKEDKEPPNAYGQRVARAVFNNRLRPTIEGNAGLLSEFEVASMPVSVEQSQDNIDNMGSDIKSFFFQADLMALRDGYCYVLADHPPASGEVQTLADQMQSTARPYLVLIDRRNLFNWRCHIEAGRMVVDHVTIQFSQEVSDGSFGVKTEIRYHQLLRTGKGVEHIIWKIADSGPEVKAIVESRNLTQLQEIPIVCYPYTQKAFTTDVPPFLKLSNLNLRLFRKESELDEIQRRVNCPTVWRRHPGDVQPPPPIIFGPSYTIEIPAGGEVGVLEISGSGIDRLQASIAELKQDIDNEGLAFLSGSNIQRTATDAVLSSTQIQASLSGTMRNKASAIVRIFDYWCKYTGEANTTQVAYDHSLLELPLDAGEMNTLMQLWQAGAISHETLLELLRMGRQLPDDFSVEQELVRIQQERVEQMQTVQPSMESLLAMPQNSN